MVNGRVAMNGDSVNKRAGKHKSPELDDLSKIYSISREFYFQNFFFQTPSSLRGPRIAERWTQPTGRSSSSSCSVGTVFPSRTGPKSASTSGILHSRRNEFLAVNIFLF